MSAFLLVPLLSCVVCAVLATAILARDPSRLANRLGAGLVGGAALWSFCEVLWNAQSDPVVALALVKASALGWAWIGPVTLHLFLEITGDPAPRVRRWLPRLLRGLGGHRARRLVHALVPPGGPAHELGLRLRARQGLRASTTPSR